MKKLFLALSLAFILFSCKDESMEETEEEETGPFSLIGTWEAEGELNDKIYTYKCTLIFYDETEFEQNDIFTSKQSGQVRNFNDKGTYTRADDKIIFKPLDSNGITSSNTYANPYTFINKNTLEAYAIGFVDIADIMTFKRKN